MAEPALDAESDEIAVARRTLDDAIRVFLEPELKRRRGEGKEVPVEVSRFQVLWRRGVSEAPEVRLNGEFQALVQVPSAVLDGKALGQSVEIPSEAPITGLRPGPGDQDLAHITVVLHGGGWALACDFRHQQGEARSHLMAAEEFLAAAEYAFSNNQKRAFLENAHSFVELDVKIELLTLGVLSSGPVHHRKIQESAEAFAHLRDSRALLVELATLRRPSRYLVGDLSIEQSDLDRIRQALPSLLERARSLTARLPGQ